MLILYHNVKRYILGLGDNMSRKPKPECEKVRGLMVTLKNKDIDYLSEKGKPNAVARKIIENHIKNEKKDKS